jgi:hypothetical protein
MNNYAQVPQLSCGGHYDLDEQLLVSVLGSIAEKTLVNLLTFGFSFDGAK